MEELYVLQLKNGKYYVGKTTDFNRRYQEHKTGSGSSWTSLHKPVKVVELRTLKDEHDENNTTKEYMKKYGIDNVRGGSYTQVSLPENFKSTLQVEIRGNTNACFKCGLQGHFARDCDTEEITIYECSNCHREFETMGSFNRHVCKTTVSSIQRGACFRCGRQGHWADDCYATYHAKGYEIDEDDY